MFAVFVSASAIFVLIGAITTYMYVQVVRLKRRVDENPLYDYCASVVEPEVSCGKIQDLYESIKEYEVERTPESTLRNQNEYLEIRHVEFGGDESVEMEPVSDQLVYFLLRNHGDGHEVDEGSGNSSVNNRSPTATNK